jgi:hypothetical protein
MGEIFGSPYQEDNYSFLWFFFWESTNVPIVQVGLPSYFHPHFFLTVFCFRVHSPIQNGTAKVDDNSWADWMTATASTRVMCTRRVWGQACERPFRATLLSHASCRTHCVEMCKCRWGELGHRRGGQAFDATALQEGQYRSRYNNLRGLMKTLQGTNNVNAPGIGSASRG